MTSETPNNTIASIARQEKKDGGVPSILDNVRNRAIETLSALVATLFEQIDDTFFELADSAHNNNEQNVYFESMRVIRLQRKRVEQSFFSQIEQDFRNLTLPSKTTKNNLPLDSLALLGHEDVEIDVAITSMVGRARCEYPTTLLQINTRLSEFLKPIKVGEDNNPLDPEQIVKHFINACDHFEMGLQSRLIFFKQFDRLVLRHYEQILLDTNQILLTAGILPDLRAIIRRTPQQSDTIGNSGSAKKDAPETQPTEQAEGKAVNQTSGQRQQPFASNGNAFGMLQDLLAATQNLQEPSEFLVQSAPKSPIIHPHQYANL